VERKKAQRICSNVAPILGTDIHPQMKAKTRMRQHKKRAFYTSQEKTEASWAPVLPFREAHSQAFGQRELQTE
jgi:hypothetical protein